MFITKNFKIFDLHLSCLTFSIKKTVEESKLVNSLIFFFFGKALNDMLSLKTSLSPGQLGKYATNFHMRILI